METDIAQFTRMSIPLVKRIYPQLIADKIIQAQPLLLANRINLVYKYSSNQMPQEETWVVKKRKKIIWRSVDEPFEPQNPV